MAKTLSDTAASAGAAKLSSQTPTTQEESDNAPIKEKEEHVKELEQKLEIKTAADEKLVELGSRYRFLNTTKWSIRCPYSKEVFPADQVTPAKVTVNQWIRSQVKAGILRVQVD